MRQWLRVGSVRFHSIGSGTFRGFRMKETLAEETAAIVGCFYSVAASRRHCFLMAQLDVAGRCALDCVPLVLFGQLKTAAASSVRSSVRPVSSMAFRSHSADIVRVLITALSLSLRRPLNQHAHDEWTFVGVSQSRGIVAV